MRLGRIDDAGSIHLDYFISRPDTRGSIRLLDEHIDKDIYIYIYIYIERERERERKGIKESKQENTCYIVW